MRYPESNPEPVTELLHGQTIEDPFRWLEDGTSESTRSWTREQGQYTESVISRYHGRDQLQTRLAKLRDMPDLGLPHGRGGTLIYHRRDVGQEHAVLYAERSGRRITVVDPNQLGQGDPMHIDWADVSHDGRYVLYGLSPHGNEWATLHVYDLEAERLLSDRIPRARYASIAFPPGDSGFYYTRYPDPGTVLPGDEHYHSRVYYHRLGEPYLDDPLIFQAPDDKRAMPSLHLSPSGRYLAIALSYGWTRTTLYLLDRETPNPPRLVFDRGEATLSPLWSGNTLLALTNVDCDAGQVVALDLDDSHLNTIIAGEDGSPFVEAMATSHHIYLHQLREASSWLRIVTTDGGTVVREGPLDNYACITGLTSSRDALYYGYSGFATPPAIRQIEADTLEDTLWAKSADPVESIQVVKEWATSSDGTRIPVYMAKIPGSVKNSRTPAVLTGYGGFDVANLPMYSPSVRAWVEQGGIYALAILRGGSEFGRHWHEMGMRQSKQNVFNDFEAAARHLIASGYTDSRHLGVTGRSNGGLLTGTFITQHPSLARAAIIGVPLLDMLRFPRFLIADLWTAEYGSPDIAEEFQWLHAYSPYHHVVDGTSYPATLIFTSEEDSRVDPMHARKMTARLQRATGSDLPILLRVAPKTGHGVGKSVATWLDEETDIWTFLAHHLI